jgi:hypothetical protein
MHVPMIEFLRCLATTMLMAWAAFAVMRAQRGLIENGRGWPWVGLAGFVAFVQWPINVWLGNPLVCPILVTVLYLLSLVGLAPDDSVLMAHSSSLSLWFKRGLVAAVGGTASGLGLWGAML